MVITRKMILFIQILLLIVSNKYAKKLIIENAGYVLKFAMSSVR